MDIILGVLAFVGITIIGLTILMLGTVFIVIAMHKIMDYFI